MAKKKDKTAMIIGGIALLVVAYEVLKPKGTHTVVPPGAVTTPGVAVNPSAGMVAITTSRITPTGLPVSTATPSASYTAAPQAYGVPVRAAVAGFNPNGVTIG